MRVTVNKTIVTWKLGRELVTAGIAHNGMSLFGNELEILLANEGQAAQAQAVIDAHDGIDPVAIRHAAAKSVADAIPSWSTWTQAEWANYFSANLSDAEADLVTSIAAARVMIKRQNLVINNLVKLVIALRDQVWPDLPE